MARKKIIFVMVEGPSDGDSLGVLLNRLYKDEAVYIHVMHCDITTKNGVNATNIYTKVGDEVKEYAKLNKFKDSDFKEIIHIVDTDGAYIPDESIVEDKTHQQAFYTCSQILIDHREKIIRRNEQKRENIDKLCACNFIRKSIPYHVFYMSCNLDHVLYNKLNSSDAEKEADAYGFSKKYRDDLCGFISYMSTSDFSVTTNYRDSWRFIKQDLHSLERHSNFALCFERDN